MKLKIYIIGYRLPEPTRMAHKIAGGFRPIKSLRS